MKMAKASEADLRMAMELCNALDELGGHWPTMPTAMSESADDPDVPEASFDRDDDRQCGAALRYLLDVADRGSLMRVVWGCAVLLDPKNQCVDPAADTIEHHPDTLAGRKARHTRPLSEWGESDGPVLWWRFPAAETPFVGSPRSADWPGTHTHWTPLTVPQQPTQTSDAENERPACEG